MTMPDPLGQLRDRINLITFDCYGTLVDWETGMRSAIAAATGRNDAEIFDAYLAADADIERSAYMPYRDVLAKALRRIAQEFDFHIPEDRRNILADTLPDWPLWPDTNDALKRLESKYRIGVLSNIDRDLFAKTASRFSIDMDLLVTAEDVRSYKPADAHFRAMLELVGGERDRVLHVAQSLYHDCVPATRLNIANVWINRREEVNHTTAQPLAEFADLGALADALELD